MTDWSNPFRAILSALPEGDGPGITLTRTQLEEWAGEALTDQQVEALEEAIPYSSIPEAINTIALSIIEEDKREQGSAGNSN